MEMIRSVVPRRLKSWWEWESCPLARQALEGVELAPGDETLQMSSDESRKPPEIRLPVPMEFTNHVLDVHSRLDDQVFLKILRTAKRGAAAGPSGMTTEHLSVLLQIRRCEESLLQVCREVGPSRRPRCDCLCHRMGRMTRFAKLMVESAVSLNRRQTQCARCVGTHCQGSRFRCKGLERVRRYGSS